MRTAAFISPILAGVVIAEPPCLTYDAADGTLPDEQGWTRVVVEPASAEVDGGILQQSTLPFTRIDCLDGATQPQSLRWEQADLDYTFDEGVVFEAEVRIVASQFNANPCNGWPRPGFAFGLEDADARRFWVGLGSDEAFLAGEAFEPFGHPGIVTADLDTTDGFHVYRLVVDGPDATFLADDVPILSLGDYGAPDAPGGRAWVGDPTSWANSEAEIRTFRVHPLDDEACESCPADFNGDGILNILDFVAFQSAFVAQDPAADCDANGVFNILDFVCFQAAFAQGCP